MNAHFSRLYLGLSLLFTTTTTGLVSAQTDTAATDTASYVMTNFDDFQLTTPLFGFWFGYTDRNSKAFPDTLLTGESFLWTWDSLGMAPLFDSLGMPDSATFPVGYNGAPGRAMKVGYQLGSRRLTCGGTCSYDPYIGFGTGFSTMGDRTLDLSSATTISFWAKADSAPLVVGVSVSDTTAAPDYGQNFTLTKEWKQYRITLAASLEFKQPNYGIKEPFNKKIITGLNFGINKGSNPLIARNAIYVDDITIQNWKYVEPPVEEPPVDTTTAILPGNASRMGAKGIRVSRSGDLIRFSLPAAYANQEGTVEAVDAMGHVLGRARFGRQAGEVAMRITAAANGSKGVYVRVITKAKIR